MKQRIIGRVQEQQILEALYASKFSEFVAVYGRRRVGKTFLVRECLEGKLTFAVSGLANSNKAMQLENFRNSLVRAGAIAPRSFENWQEAFESLIGFLLASKKRRKVVFLDELPWMDTPKSDFISALAGGLWFGYIVDDEQAHQKPWRPAQPPDAADPSTAFYAGGDEAVSAWQAY